MWAEITTCVFPNLSSSNFSLLQLLLVRLKARTQSAAGLSNCPVQYENFCIVDKPSCESTPTSKVSINEVHFRGSPLKVVKVNLGNFNPGAFTTAALLSNSLSFRPPWF